MKRWELELVADFIIKDRERVVEPLVKLNCPEEMSSFEQVIHVIEAVTQILKNAAIDTDK